MKKILISIAMILSLGSCVDDAQMASHNISEAADNFEILRRIVFYNGITDKYILSIEGLCSFTNRGDQINAICKKGPNSYVKHSMGLSHNVTYFSEQMRAESVSTYHYRVVFKPQAILPDIDFKGSAKALFENKGKQ